MSVSGGVCGALGGLGGREDQLILMLHFIPYDPAHPAASAFCSNLHCDEMQLPHDHNSLVSAVRGSDEAQSNPPPESQPQSLSSLSPLCL